MCAYLPPRSLNLKLCVLSEVVEFRSWSSYHSHLSLGHYWCQDKTWDQLRCFTDSDFYKDDNIHGPITTQVVFTGSGWRWRKVHKMLTIVTHVLPSFSQVFLRRRWWTKWFLVLLSGEKEKICGVLILNLILKNCRELSMWNFTSCCFMPPSLLIIVLGLCIFLPYISFTKVHQPMSWAKEKSDGLLRHLSLPLF